MRERVIILLSAVLLLSVIAVVVLLEGASTVRSLNGYLAPTPTYQVVPQKVPTLFGDYICGDTFGMYYEYLNNSNMVLGVLMSDVEFNAVCKEN